MIKRQSPKILVVCGPTATGKSDLAVELARVFNGEIVSADSRQVYRGMDISSGKITKQEMKGVPHHLLDVADPKRVRYTVENFKRDAGKAIEDILSRGKLPIVCGGTGFYIDALVFDEQFPDVPPNRPLRTKLEKKEAKDLMKTLSKIDPRRAKEIDPNNKVRIIRAIEIAKALGSVPKLKRRKKYDVTWIGLTVYRDSLCERIRTRLEKRMKKGMLREISRLHESGVSWKRMHEFGLEYRYLALILQKKLSRGEAVEALEREICRFAKRQMMWFKRNKDIKWFEPRQDRKVVAAVRSALK